MIKNRTSSPRKTAAAFGFCICFLIFFMGYSHALETGIDKTEGLGSVEKVKKLITRTEDRLKTLNNIKPDRVAAEFGIRIEDFEKRILDLQALISAGERLLYAIEALDKVKKEYSAFNDQFNNKESKLINEDPPYKLSFLDAIHEDQLNIERGQQNIDSTIEVIRREIEQDREQLQTLEKALRQENESLAEADEKGKKTLQWRAETLELHLNKLQAIIRAKESEILRHETEKNLASLKLALLKEKTDFVRLNLAFDPEDLDRQRSGIQEKKGIIQKEMERLRSEQTSIEKKWKKARQNFEEAISSDEKVSAASYLKSRDEWRKTYQVAIELDEQTMLLMDRQDTTWQKRYDLLKGKLTMEELKTLREKIKGNLDNTNQILQIQQSYLTTLQNQIAAIETQNEENSQGPAIRKNLSDQLAAYRKRLDRRLSYQAAILATDRIEKRLLNEIEIKIGQSTLQEHLSGIKKDISDFWNIEIWTVDNHSVTIRKVSVAIVILLFGMIAAKYFLFIVRTRFLLKSQFKETTASAVHKLLSYAVYLLVFLFALRMVNIPLTAFAFLGGAVAIGIGFGAQNLINNFISGFMILGERPINIGDLTEVDGVLGMVEEIGARCTRVRTGENIHILVPNSTFLENNIINWTLSDKKIRTNVTVGVSYGSPIQTVKERLLESVAKTPRILTYPAPFVLFSDFGDNALIFNVYFWIEINRVIERKEIESNVRFKIDELFAEQGLVIAFPQRDIHLDTQKPLQIQVDQNWDRKKPEK